MKLGNQAKYKFDVDTKVAIFEYFLKQIDTSPRNFPCILFFSHGFRFVSLLWIPVSGQNCIIRRWHRKSSDVKPRYFDRNLQCLSVDFVLLLNTKIHHVYSGKKTTYEGFQKVRQFSWLVNGSWKFYTGNYPHESGEKAHKIDVVSFWVYCVFNVSFLLNTLQTSRRSSSRS